MSNSSLAKSHYWTNNFSSRNGQKITKIAIHHVAGNLNAKQCYQVWRTREASAHYVIDSKGNVGQCVDEKYRAWSLASSYWDSRAVAIECANISGSPSWAVSDATIKSLIKLCADIAWRNGIEKITYTGDLGGTLIMHRWVCSTACPGPYLSKKFSYIASEANKLLQEKKKSTTQKTEVKSTIKTEVKGATKTVLAVDGNFGPASIRRAQQVFKTPIDGIISGQLSSLYPYYTGIQKNRIEFGGGGSSLVKAIQKAVKVPQDGTLGPVTIKALQKALGITADGYWGSATSKAFQKWLNTK